MARTNTNTGGGGGGGTVTDFIFTDGLGFVGTVLNPTTTPTLSLTTSLTLGSVPFIGAGGALTQSNANFFYDATNNALGLGTTSPFTDLGRLKVLGGKVASTHSGGSLVNFRDASTYNTTASDKTNYATIISNASTISSGANALTNVALLVSASGGTNNYALIASSGIVGIGTTTPSSLLDLTTNSLGVTQTTTSGLALVNTTAAAAGAQQISPAIRWSAQGWKTNATAASQAVDFRSYVLPVQGAANPTGNWILQSSINGGAYASRFGISSVGEILITGTDPGVLNQVLISQGPGVAAAWGTLSIFALTNGNGTVANGTAVDLGGSLTGNTSIDVNGTTFEFVEGANQFFFIDVANENYMLGDINNSGNGGKFIIQGLEARVESPNGKILFVEDTLAAASNGYVWTLADDTTGEGGWAPAPGGSGMTWTEVTGTSQSMAINSGYIANNAALVTLTLPDTAAVGSIVRVTGLGAGGWRIAQNAGEQIIWEEGGVDGTNETTIGVGGRLDSTDDYDSIELICLVANTTWGVLSSKGNIALT